MKWFKHKTDNHRGQWVQQLLDELGYFGPFFVYTIFELCAEKVSLSGKNKLEKEDMVFRFHRRVIESTTRAKRLAVGRALVAGQLANLFSHTIDGEFYEISIPMLLESLEYDQKNRRKSGVRAAECTVPDKDKDKDVDVDAGETTTSAPKISDQLKSPKIPDPVRDSFSEEVEEIREVLRKEYGNRFDRYVIRIFNHWGDPEKFYAWAADVQKRKAKNKNNDQSLVSWLEICIKKELGVISEKSV